MLKKLVAGKYSLPITFWAFGFGGYAAISAIFWLAGIFLSHNPAFIVTKIAARLILAAFVLSGITSILSVKFSVLGAVAFLFFLISFSINGLLIISIAFATFLI